jgi:putative PIN family toxin of toxin-antitoxin system
VRLLIDTNVLLSGILWKGAPHHLLEKIRDGEATLITSADLIEELAEVIARPKFSAILTRLNLSVESIVHDINLLAEIVVPIPLANPACRDSDDDIVLATALTGQVDLIVSGDADLLDMKQFQLIPIVGATEAIHRLSE